ncbi:MAG: 3-oxoacyl-[acyl-carrier-protein] reductase [Chloroflexi bacterium]|nr:MAG: 3-oxoacyl-[acyl-carrier-protein] reductase [Chloroflexota bacterium]
MRFEGKVAVVTGGARGIGRAVALRLAREGASVVVNYLSNQAAADEVGGQIQAAGGQAIAVQCDVSNVAQAQALVERAREAFGRVDVLVNNAGTTRDTLIMRMTEEDWDLVIDTNLKGAFNCVKAASRPMVKQRYGRIINITSVAGLDGNAGQANYASAKAGLVGLTKTVAKELGSRGITCNAVAPGYVPTDLTASLPGDLVQLAIDRAPLGRAGTVEDIAAAVAYLASDEASFVTGQVLAVDGGLLIA